IAGPAVKRNRLRRVVGSANLEIAFELARHHGDDIAGAPAAGAADLDRRHEAAGCGFDRHAPARRAPMLAAQIEIDDIAEPVEPDAVAADPQLRRLERGILAQLSRRAEVLDMAAAIELQAHARR